MKKFDSINVIPFIDIMLVLLAIVLTTATFVANGDLDIALPASGQSSAPAPNTTLEIAIDRSMQLYLDGVATTPQQLRQHLHNSDQDAAVVLLIDESVPFEHFVRLIDLLKDRSMERVTIRTRKTAT